MKVSIITAVFNSAETIEDCIKSVANQTYSNIEHIIIDGNSTDGTLDVINKYKHKIARIVSEPDNGIYDALNKGIRLAGGDIIGILHSDDFYAHDRVIEKVVDTFVRYNVDSCYGDLQYVARNDINRVIRYWKSSNYKHGKFKYGWMPPHPTFFVKKSVYENYGLLNLDFPLAADYELMLRFLYKYRISTTYIPEVLVKMRTGGTSKPGSYTIGAILENYRAWKVNNLNYPITMLFKPFSKISQFFKPQIL